MVTVFKYRVKNDLVDLTIVENMSVMTHNHVGGKQVFTVIIIVLIM